MPDYFMDDIALVPWGMIELTDNPKRAWDGGVETFFFAPVKKKRVRNSKAPWLTPEIKQLM